MAPKCLSIFLLLLLTLAATTTTTSATTITLTNNCSFTIWPGTLSNSDKPPLNSTGFPLDPSATTILTAPTAWGGRLWARTLCTTDPSSGKFTCKTADYGSGTVECSGHGATPPATLTEFTLSGYGNKDFYDVSLVDGYNIPMLVAPSSNSCNSTGCVTDLNRSCPPELRVVDDASGNVIACKSACEAFGSPKYCCSGAFGTPESCRPSSYSQLFKSACPSAYSYAYDDKSSTFTCSGASDYVITFCPNNPVPSTSKGGLGVDGGDGGGDGGVNLPATDGSAVMINSGGDGDYVTLTIVSLLGVFFAVLLWAQ